MSADYTKRTANLKAASDRKSGDAEAKARRAIMALTSRGLPVNFASVAVEAGVSTAFLYKHQRLRAEIADLRSPPPSRIEARLASTRSREASNAVKLAVASNALRDLRRENAALRDENARLRGELTALRRSPRPGSDPN